MAEDREDIDVGFVNVTRKQMANGEVRERVRYKDGTAVSRTTAAPWRPEEGIPWQEPHYHRGLTEVYVLLQGSAWFVSVHNSEVVREELSRPGQTITFAPDIPHLVLPGPGARFLTTLCGEPIGNPDRKDNDWYPTGDDFWLQTKALRENVELMVMCQYSTTQPGIVPEAGK